MRVALRCALALLALSVVACSDEDASATSTPVPAATPAPSESPPEPPPLYDAEGRLLPSGERVAGLVLPVGLELDFESRREHVYRTDVPIAKVLGYFGPRLFTGTIEAIGGGAVYRHAQPLEARGAVVHLDVSILPGGDGRTRVQIFEIASPPPAAPGSDAAARAARSQGYRALD